MPNRPTDLETIEQALTRLENRLVDRYRAYRPSDQQASIAPRYGPARAPDAKPAEAVKTTRGQLHSPLQGAAILTRLASMAQTPEMRAKPLIQTA